MGRILTVALLAAAPAQALAPMHPVLPDLPIMEPDRPAPVDCLTTAPGPCDPRA